MKSLKLYILNNRIKSFIDVLISLLGIALFYLNYKLLGGQMGTTTKLSLVVYCLVIPLMLLFFKSRNVSLRKNEKILSLIFAIIISQCITLGSYADAVDFFSLCFKTPLTSIIWLLQSVIYSYVAFYFVQYIVDCLQNSDVIRRNRESFSFKKLFWIIFAINVLFIFILYPCVFDFDGALGLRTYLNPDDVKSNHHPYLIQMIHGLFWKIGSSIGAPSVGFAILTLIYCIFTSIILTYGISLLFKYGVRLKYLYFILLVAPVYLFISHLPTKDGFFAYSFLCYTLTIFEIVMSGKECLKFPKLLILHFLSILFMCLSRNQGIYIVIVESIFLLLYCFGSVKNCIRLSLAIVPAILMALLFEKVYLPSQNVFPSSRAEMFGTLFQQTALCVTRHPDDISDKEAAAINAILPIDEIKNTYTPEITDYVKGCYCPFGHPGVTGSVPDKSDGLIHFSNKTVANERGKLLDYLFAWCSMLIKHPITYLDSWFAVDYGFFYNKGQMLCILATDWPDSKATTPEFAFRQNKGMHVFVNNIFGYSVNTPIVNWVFAIPCHIWLFILILFVLILRKDRRGIILILPSVLSVGVLLLCPVCDARYMYPILVCLPFYALYVLLTNKTKITNE